MNTTARTAGPWIHVGGQVFTQAVGNKWGDPARIVAATGAGDDPENVANAAFIVLACNAHDELVAALRGLLAPMASIREIELAKADARAALAKAGAL